MYSDVRTVVVEIIIGCLFLFMAIAQTTDGIQLFTCPEEMHITLTATVIWSIKESYRKLSGIQVCN